MAKSLLSIQCMQSLRCTQSWASSVDWRQRESEIREMIASIAHKINKLQAWEIRRRLARSNRDHQKKRSLHLAFRHSKRAASLSNAEVYMDEESATHVEAEAHFGELDSARQYSELHREANDTPHLHLLLIYSLTVLPGLGDLGYAMDVEMAAVPTNCREDDDAQTTSEVLALGVDTVEQYLSSLLLTADRYLERAKSQRMEKIRERILRP
ncbi:uncharacterized protein LOC34620965 [Cyclospora cayetanensis]|uniref:Uncharacterized protein LOC34620965 n=1 Tax=Cyclospora cayetanensis TaxID=88456 RepID=A0A6P6RW29_9EIME|nr:uncharacterized protein LOC34620965 [Cyclospora cayetanensis]